MNGRLAPLKSKLDSYHNLPPDLALARTKIAEANLQLVSSFLNSPCTQFCEIYFIIGGNTGDWNNKSWAECESIVSAKT